MAEENAKVTENTSTEEVVTETTETVENNKPDVDALMAELAAEKAARLKDKAALDKALKEKGDLTKTLRAKMTASEQEEELKKEAERQREEELNSVKSELNHIKAVAAYKAISDEKIVEELINAISDADHAAIANIIENEKSKAVKIAQAEWMKSRPPVNNGSGVAMTKEQILAIQDQAERQRMIAANMELFQN